MCYFCHTLFNNPGARRHKSENCHDTRNTFSKNPTVVAARQAAVVAARQAAAAAPVVHLPGSFLWQIKALSGNRNVHPQKVNASKGARIWDGFEWRQVCQVLRFGNTVRVSWVDGPMGTPVKFHDFAI